MSRQNSPKSELTEPMAPESSEDPQAGTSLDDKVDRPIIPIHDESPRESPKLSIKQLLAASLGNLVEWYDFALYGFFADEISETFFDGGHEKNVFWTYVIFGGAFMMRPLGGMVCGYVGDKYGREYALRFTISLMGISTVLLGCIPSYAVIGGWSTFFLAVARFMQGFGVGGELVGAFVYALENSPKDKKLFRGALILGTANTGTWLGAFVSAIWHGVFTQEQLFDYAWRIPFIASGVVAFIGWWFRRDMKSGSEFHRSESTAGNPIVEALKTQRPAILRIVLMVGTWSACLYVTFIWAVEWVSSLTSGEKLKHAYAWNLIGTTFLVISMPVTGWLLGNWNVLVSRAAVLSGTATGISLPILYYLVQHNLGKPFPYVLLLFGASLTLGTYGGLVAIFMYDQVPNARLRYTTLGIGYNLAHAIFGGTAPAIATALLERNPIAPAFYLSMICLMSVLSLMCLKQSPTSYQSFGGS